MKRKILLLLIFAIFVRVLYSQNCKLNNHILKTLYIDNWQQFCQDKALIDRGNIMEYASILKEKGYSYFLYKDSKKEKLYLAIESVYPFCNGLILDNKFYWLVDSVSTPKELEPVVINNDLKLDFNWETDKLVDRKLNERIKFKVYSTSV